MTDEKTANKEADNSEDVLVEKKVTIEFPYSEKIRDRIPKAFEVAETVATKWKNDEKFENIGLAHPLAEIAAVKALEKAKQVEKKLEEKGVFAILKVGTEMAKSKVNSILKKS
jgi:hypothetical protein